MFAIFALTFESISLGEVKKSVSFWAAAELRLDKYQQLLRIQSHQRRVSGRALFGAYIKLNYCWNFCICSIKYFSFYYKLLLKIFCIIIGDLLPR